MTTEIINHPITVLTMVGQLFTELTHARETLAGYEPLAELLHPGEIVIPPGQAAVEAVQKLQRISKERFDLIQLIADALRCQDDGPSICERIKELQHRSHLLRVRDDLIAAIHMRLGQDPANLSPGYSPGGAITEMQDTIGELRADAEKVRTDLREKDALVVALTERVRQLTADLKTAQDAFVNKCATVLQLEQAQLWCFTGEEHPVYYVPGPGQPAGHELAHLATADELNHQVQTIVELRKQLADAQQVNVLKRAESATVTIEGSIDADRVIEAVNTEVATRFPELDIYRSAKLDMDRARANLARAQANLPRRAGMAPELAASFGSRAKLPVPGESVREYLRQVYAVENSHPSQLLLPQACHWREWQHDDVIYFHGCPVLRRARAPGALWLWDLGVSSTAMPTDVLRAFDSSDWNFHTVTQLSGTAPFYWSLGAKAVVQAAEGDWHAGAVTIRTRSGGERTVVRAPGHFVDLAPDEFVIDGFVPNSHVRVGRAHELYEGYDPAAPEAIKDGNGEVCLGMCKVCGQAEVELEPVCPGNREWMKTAEGISDAPPVTLLDWARITFEDKHHSCIPEKCPSEAWAVVTVPGQTEHPKSPGRKELRVTIDSTAYTVMHAEELPEPAGLWKFRRLMPPTLSNYLNTHVPLTGA